MALDLVTISELTTEILLAQGNENLAVDDTNQVDGEGKPITKKISLTNVVLGGLPTLAGNANKVLKVNSAGDAIEWGTDVAGSSLPDFAGNANKLLAVNTAADAAEWITAAGAFIKSTGASLPDGITAIKTIPLASAKMVTWFIHAVNAADSTKVFGCRIIAIHDGTSVSYEEIGPAAMGGAGSEIGFNVSISGTDLVLNASNADTVNNYTLSISEQIMN